MATVLTGARAKISFKNKDGQLVPVGFATGITANENQQLQRVNVLGNIDSEEIVPVNRAVDVRCDFVRISGESLRSQGIWPQGATAQVLDFPELTMQVFDAVSNNIIFQIEGVRCENRSFQVQAGSLVSVNATFQAKRFKEEADLTV